MFTRKSWIRVLTVMLAALFATAPLTAEAVLSANDLQAAAITESKTIEGFTILATAAKGVTVEAVEKPRTAADGEIFNLRIKLNGSGAADFRAIKFTAAAGAKLVIYLSSSSKTDARTLKLLDASGASIADLIAPPDDEVNAGMVSAEIKAAGECLLYSSSGGINIYQIVVK